LLAHHLNPHHHTTPHNIPSSLASATPLLQASLALTTNNNNNNNNTKSKGIEKQSSRNSRGSGKSSPHSIVQQSHLLNLNCNGTKDLIGANQNNNNNTKGQSQSSRARASPVSVSSSTEVPKKKAKKSQNGSPRTFQVSQSYHSFIQVIMFIGKKDQKLKRT